MPHEIGAKSANLSTATGAIRVSAIGLGVRDQEGPTARGAGRRTERLGRFPSSRPNLNLRLGRELDYSALFIPA
jgi:hypothetical protein